MDLKIKPDSSGLVPAIHNLRPSLPVEIVGMDGRHNAGHDENNGENTLNEIRMATPPRCA
ncbi:MAG: hypothetical protein ACREDM_16670 [Methylocella sp.]